jgi:TRAP-type transport system periplasmic protein
MIKNLVASAAAVFVALGLSTGIAKADATKLLVTSMSPPGSEHSQQFNEWAKRVDAASQGTLALEIRDGSTVANFGNIFDRLTGDVVQIGWVAEANIGGRFPLSEVVGLPFLADSAETGAVGFWRLYKSGLLDAEYKDIVPLWVFAGTPNTFHFVKEPKNLDDLKGQKIQVFAKTLGDFVQNMGATPISLMVTQAYESLQRGVVDATLIGWSNPFRLDEVTFFHLEGPFGVSPHVIAMTRAKFASLPEAAQKALVDNSGEAQSRKFGAYLDGFAGKQRGPNMESAKHKVVRLPQSAVPKWRKAADLVTTGWVNGDPARQKVLDTYRSFLPQ